ncbi:Mitochondrial-processing peptidase subunit beta [Phytophthora cinnamomi]|uniref:Mitochondrial-processing peptidase subunit beta n=1 Tax=Phytophthora cinnamomi TaxID=4785 RepID=UPI00355A6E4B|nr:Mitochondrial-processing peptidase subunit beta [Phytophthora cinnamomi]
MLRLIRSPAVQRLVLSRGVASSRPLLRALQTAKPPLTSLNNAAAEAQLGLEGTLEEVASAHFSESSAFPEFSPMEDTLLSQAVPRIPRPEPVMDAHALAVEQLLADMQTHFCESSDFPEYTPAEEEAMMHKEM